jgi:hypothetical protein
LIHRPSNIQLKASLIHAALLLGHSLILVGISTCIIVLGDMVDSSSFHFYYKGKVIYNNNPLVAFDSATKNSNIYFASMRDLRALTKDSLQLTILKTFPHFRVSQLNIQFLNHLSRSKTLDTFAIAKIK